MRRTPRFFSSKLSTAERRVYRAATAWFVLVAAAMVWPLVVPFARARPLVLGMPFALFWLASVLVVSFGVGVALYRWEARRGFLDAEVDDGAPQTEPVDGDAGDVRSDG